MLIVRGLIGGLFQLGFFAVFLLIPAGTWHWPRAIWFLVAYGVVLLISIIWLARVAPASLEARLEPVVSKTQPVADRIVSFFLIVSLFGWMAFIPTDVFRLQLFPAPSIGVSILGAALFFAGFGVILTALYQNAFAAPIVKDQSNRGQVVIDTGLYARVRHPFYLGLLPFLMGLALWLQSYAAVLALLIPAAFLIARIFVEEKTLRETLPGYAEYMERVRWRIVPRIW